MRSPTVRQVASAIRNNPGWSWGGLHIVYEDENLEADSIDWCLTQEDTPLTDEERAFAKMLKGMTLKARVSAFGLARGYFT